MAVSIDSVIEAEAKKTEYRKRYNQEPKVIERRKLYNSLRQAEAKIARAVLNGNQTMQEGEAAIATLREKYEESLRGLNGSFTQLPEHIDVEESTTDVENITPVSLRVSKKKKSKVS